MDTGTLLTFVKRWSYYIAASTVVGALAALLVTTQMPRTYQATTTLIVGASLTSPQVGYDDLLVSQTLAQTYAAVAASRSVIDAAAADVANVDADAIAGAVSVRVPPSSSFVIITVEYRDADSAAAIANAVADSLIATSPTAEATDATAETLYEEALAANLIAIDDARAERDALLAIASPTAEQAAQLTAVRSQLAALDAARNQLLESDPDPGTNQLTVIDPAVKPATASGPRVLLNVALGAAIGFAVGLALALVLHPIVTGRSTAAGAGLTNPQLDAAQVADPRWPSSG